MKTLISEETDHELWSRAANGDTRAFDKLYFRYWELLLNEAFKILKVQEEAEDVVQSLFVSLYERMAEVDVRDVKGYLLKANRYAIYKIIRTYTTDQKYREQLNDLEITGIDDSLTEWFEYKELEQRIRISVQKLPEKCREVFILSRDHHLSYAEIALQLGISERTVENHISKALRMLREGLMPDYSQYLRILLVLGC